jgi:hypothetical protein
MADFFLTGTCSGQKNQNFRMFWTRTETGENTTTARKQVLKHYVSGCCTGPTRKQGLGNQQQCKLCDNDDNQTLYTAAKNWLCNSHWQGITAVAILVAKPHPI